MRFAAALAVLVCASCAAGENSPAPPSATSSELAPAAAELPGAPAETAPPGDVVEATPSPPPPPAPWDGSRDVGEAADEASRAATTKDASELQRRLDLQLRAGHDDDAVVAMDALRAADPPVELSVASVIADTLIDAERDALARRMLERFPAARAGWTYVLLARWAATAGWQAPDRWAAERASADPEAWLRERIVLRQKFGAATELLDELKTAAQSRPTNTDGLIAWVEAARWVEPRPDASWVAEVARPALAFDAAQLGERLRDAHAPGAAVVVLDRSLAMPFTEADAEAMRAWFRTRHAAAELGPDTVERREATLRRSTRFQLADALLAAGEAARAQTVLESLAADAKATGDLPDLFLAGRIQAASGARVIEKRVVEAEETEADTVEYWRRRVDYYRGRGEEQSLRVARTRLLAAIDRDLASATWEAARERRYFLVGESSRVVEAVHGKRAAYDVLRGEIATMPQTLPEAGFYADRLAMDFEKLVGADDPVFWRLLEARAAWDLRDKRLLWTMAKSVNGAGRDAFWTRAEALAAAGPPARSYILGWVMTRTDASPRAVPLLRAAVAGIADAKGRADAAVTLVEACEATGDWRTAEAALSLTRPHLTFREFPEWAAKPARIAAKAGANDDAMRLWAAKVNLDRGELTGLDELRKTGLGDRLRAFYRDLVARDPKAASVVACSLAVLGK